MQACRREGSLPRRRRFRPLWLAVLGCLAAPLGCKPGGRRSRGTAPATLAVRVDPPQGISVLLDGLRVAERSPYVDTTVAPGSHVLEVRAMGRYPISLPLTLEAGETVEVPVVLRPRSPTPFVDRPTTAAPSPALADPTTTHAPAGGTTVVSRPPSLVRPGAGLPAGATPLRLAVAPTPPARILADGVEMAGTDVRLGYGHGVMWVGEMRLSYRIYPGRALELTVPHEPVPWFLGEQQIKAKSVVRVTATPLVLRRGTGPSEQRAWMRRLQ